ncbi:MAG: class I SAM-dependent methyltransferase [Gammaproteobacteria bacterium]|jgi:predicted O-methyltransferase YrrM|nr:MAG: class I SAM-dependent methyltransferase [Gammaproteobacteria bacterium]
MMKLPIDPETVKGFLDPSEGARLYELAAESAALGPCLEVGSYCGKSTIYLAAACGQAGQQVFAIDHHRGSEEHQLGEEYHDSSLYDSQLEKMDTFPEFRRNLDRAGLTDSVVPIVAGTQAAGRHWRAPLGMVFIDGGHSEEAALTDYRTWAPHLVPGGILAIHDIFPNPEEGGQAPHHIYQLALASGLFEPLPMVKTLGALKRL